MGENVIHFATYITQTLVLKTSPRSCSMPIFMQLSRNDELKSMWSRVTP